MQLYTSLVQLKRAMNGGQMPPMTPLPESVHHLIDPAFTIGLGALTEEAEKGLRCPVRGCGKWFQSLQSHLNTVHRGTGGASAVRRALEIPDGAPLVSKKLSEVRKADTQRRMAEGAWVPGRARRALKSAPRPAKESYRRGRSGMGVRNLRNSCVAQLSHALIDLHHELGRSPTVDEAIAKFGHGWMHAVRATFGSFGNAKAQCGLEVYHGKPKRTPLETVLTALETYHAINGTLPSADQACDPRRTPVIPTYHTIRKALGEPTWYDCMRKAARILGIRDGRYGLQPFPDERESAA